MSASIIGWLADLWARRRGGEKGGESGESGEWQDGGSIEMKNSNSR